MEALFAEKPILGSTYNNEVEDIKTRHEDGTHDEPKIFTKNTRRIKTIKKALDKKRTTAKRPKKIEERQAQIDWLEKFASALKEETVNVEEAEVRIAKTLDDGNCFYSAIYRALKERDSLLNDVSECLKLNTKDETKFIMSFRDKIADIVSSGHLPGSGIGNNDKLEGPLDMYNSLSQAVQENYPAITEGFPPWFKVEFGEDGEHLGERPEFIKKLAKHIKQNKEWAGEIEVTIAKEELDKCNIVLTVRSNSNSLKLPKRQNSKDVIYLYNPEEVHYEYFSFEKEHQAPPVRKKKFASPLEEETVNVEEAEETNTNEGSNDNQSTNEEAEVTIANESNENIDKRRHIYLNQKLDKCKEECENIKKEKKALEDFLVKKDIEGISLSAKKKLIDLLIERILDISPNWKHKIDTLINIPTALKGEGFLRGGDYFEALFQLAIAIGIIPSFSNKFVRFYDIDKYKKLIPLNNYLYVKTILNSGGGEQGISDITFEVSENIEFDETKINKTYECGQPPLEQVVSKNPFYFISVKGYKKEKSIKNEYDIPLLDQQIREFSDKNKHIIVCVRDKERFLENLSRTKIDFLKNSINYIFGYDDIMDAFTKFRLNFFRRIQHDMSIQNIKREVYRTFPKNTVFKQTLSLYFHQELVVKSVINRINKVNNATKPHFLCIGVLPRGGKSFIAGGIIDTHKKLKAKSSGYNVLFLTSAVNETRAQFKEDLIEKFTDFSDFQFIDVVNYDKKKEEKGNKFYFISRQLSGKTKQHEEGGVTDEIDIISKSMFDTLESKLGVVPSFDIIFFDEAHIGITSTTIRSNFQKAFDRFKIPIVLMTATYKKPAKFLDSTEDLFIWDLQDIKDMKSLPVLNLDGFIKKRPDVLERYNNVAVDILNYRIGQGEELDAITKPYVNFPNPNFISLTFTPKTIAHLKDIGEGYDFTKAFELNVDTNKLLDNTKYLEWGSMIRNREHAIKLRQFMTPEQDLSNPDEIKTPFLQNKDRKYRALNQIFTIAQKNGSRPVQGKPFSILMFLPFGFGSRDNITKIGELCRIWAAFMLESTYWKENFVFLTLSTYNNPKYKKDPKITIQLAVKKGLCHRDDHNLDLKELIIELEKEALRQGKGLVILSGDVAKMGISLKCVDVVFLMSNNKEADDIIQKMYRALTDDSPNKKDGFIVDLDLKRIITAMFEYDLEKDKMRTNNPVLPTVGERLNKVWELCNWGQDSYIEENPEMNFNTIMDEIKRRVLADLETRILHDFDKVFKNIEETQKKLIREDYILYNEMTEALKFTTGKKDAKPKPVKMGERGQDIPEVQREQKEEQGNQDPAKKQMPLPPPKPMLSEAEIEGKMISIIKTFVNSLVIKSSEPWVRSLNLVSLLEKYKKDKYLVKGIAECDCNKVKNCKKEHNNLFETVFCELSSFAMIFIDKDKYKYNKDTHRKIISLVEDIFKNSSILVEWNTYIENLIREIKTAKKTGGSRKTLKVKKYIIPR
jgi:Type III restriction enzyme, res subunit